jgi:alkylated DNA repair dioxygenase AlkB
MSVERSTPDLFGDELLPDGMKYQADFLTRGEEQSILSIVERLPFEAFEFRGFTGKRRVVSYGWRYDFNGGGLSKSEAIPDFLSDIRAHAERFAGLAPLEFQQVLITEYPPGAGIGWHKDRSIFGEVAGISLQSPCEFRLRKRSTKGFLRRSLIAEPRSIYLLRGPSRRDWEHSIPGVNRLRYSITFRNLTEG